MHISSQLGYPTALLTDGACVESGWQSLLCNCCSTEYMTSETHVLTGYVTSVSSALQSKAAVTTQTGETVKNHFHAFHYKSTVIINLMTNQSCIIKMIHWN